MKSERGKMRVQNNCATKYMNGNPSAKGCERPRTD